MILLTSTSDLLRVTTSSAAVIKSHASHVDRTRDGATLTPGRLNTETNTATTTTIVASPSSLADRTVQFVSIFNDDDSLSCAVTVSHTDGTNISEIWAATLGPKECLQYDEGAGWSSVQSLYATNAQGVLAETAVQPGDLATVATSGDYDDLSGTPTLGTAAATDATDYATAAQGTLADSALQVGDDAADLGSGSATIDWVLTADGAGGAAWQEGGGSAGGSDTQVQFNDGGAFGGDSGFTFDKTNNTLGLGGGTITASDPIIDMAQTWNNGAVAFTALKANVTDTASAAGSLLMDLQVGGASRFNVTKAGLANSAGGYIADAFPSLIGFQVKWGPAFTVASMTTGNGEGTVTVSGDGAFRFASSALTVSSPDVFLRRDAANTLAQRNGVNAQAFNLYSTYTDASNYERGFMRFVSNFLQIGTEKLGTGATRGMELSTPYGGPLVQQANNVWEFCNTNRTFPSIRMACGSGAFVGASMQIGFNAADFFTSGTVDAGFKRSAAAVIGVTNGSTGGGSLQLQEVTAPAAPATNNVRIYAEDDGAGKTRLMALFATGAAVQIAIEP